MIMTCGNIVQHWCHDPGGVRCVNPPIFHPFMLDLLENNPGGP
jgi:hypothetical protein